MIAMLMAAAAAFFVAILGTPLLIRALRKRGIGQQIRDDGPIEHPHVHKAGTPTMGGLAIVGAVVVGYLVAHIRRADVDVRELGLDVADPHRRSRVRRLRRRLPRCARPPQPRTAQARQDARASCSSRSLFAILSIDWVHVSTMLSWTRPLDFDFTTLGWIMWAILVVYADRERA